MNYKKNEVDSSQLLKSINDLATKHKSDMTSINGTVNDLMNNTISGLINNLSTNHNHDNRYYTESEINSKISTINTAINGKAASNHNHTAASIGAAAASHTHDDRYYTESEINTKINAINTSINNMANSSHTHDNRYYTETEIDTKLNSKANTSHSHNDLYYTKKVLKDRFLLNPYDCTCHSCYLQNQSRINEVAVPEAFRNDNGFCYITHLGQVTFTYISSLYIEKASTYNNSCNTAAVGLSIDCTTKYSEYISEDFLSNFYNFGHFYLRKNNLTQNLQLSGFGGMKWVDSKSAIPLWNNTANKALTVNDLLPYTGNTAYYITGFLITFHPMNIQFASEETIWLK